MGLSPASRDPARDVQSPWVRHSSASQLLPPLISRRGFSGPPVSELLPLSAARIHPPPPVGQGHCPQCPAGEGGPEKSVTGPGSHTVCGRAGNDPRAPGSQASPSPAPPARGNVNTQRVSGVGVGGRMAAGLGRGHGLTHPHRAQDRPRGEGVWSLTTDRSRCQQRGKAPCPRPHLLSQSVPALGPHG